MHREALSNSAVSVPDCVLIDFYETKGTTPTARWGHTAVAVNDKLYVFGGDGDQVLEDLHVFQPGEKYATMHTALAAIRHRLAEVIST